MKQQSKTYRLEWVPDCWARPNPAKAIALRPNWRPLTGARGSWNADVREATSKRSGVYAVRDRSSGQVLYVGESHTGRLWKTILRHFQDRSGKFEALGEWTHGAPERLEISVWLSPPDAAIKLEARAQRRFKPSQIVREPAPF